MLTLVIKRIWHHFPFRFRVLACFCFVSLRRAASISDLGTLTSARMARSKAGMLAGFAARPIGMISIPYSQLGIPQTSS